VYIYTREATKEEIAWMTREIRKDFPCTVEAFRALNDAEKRHEKEKKKKTEKKG
jgi:hypothetical protein